MSGFVVANAQVNVTADTSKATSTISSTFASGGGLFKTAGAFAGGILGANIVTKAASIITGGLTGAWDRSINLQNAQAKLEGLGYSITQIKGLTTDTLNAVQGTAFSLSDAFSVVPSLLASGIKPGKDLTDQLKTIGDTATITGSSFKDIATIFSQVAANGKLQTQDMQQLQDRGLPVLQLLAQHYHITAAAAQKMVTDGQVSFATFSSVIEDKVAGSALKSGDTAQGAFANMQSALARFGAQFTGPIIAAIPSFLKKITGGLDDLGKSIAPVAAQFGKQIQPAMAKLGDIIADTVLPAIVSIFNFIATHQALMGNLAKVVGILAGAFVTLKAAGAAYGAYQTILAGIQKAGSLSMYLLTSAVGENTAAMLVAAGTRIASIAETGILVGMYAAQAVATGVVTAAQWLFNVAMDANPIGLVILGIAALIAIIVLLVTHWSQVTAFLGTVWNAAIQGVVAGLNWLSGLWQSVWGAIVSFVVGVWNNIKSFISGAISGIVNFARAYMNAYFAMWSAIWNAVKNFVVSIWNGIIAGIRGAISLVVSVVSGIRARIIGAVSGAAAWLVSTGSQVISGIINGIRGAIGGVASIIGTIKGKVTGAISGAASWLVSVGKNIIDGVVTGIRNAGPAIVTALLSAANAGKDAILNFFGIHSPSRVMRDEVGKMLPAGVALGITQNSGLVTDAFQNMMSIPPVGSYSAGVGVSPSGTINTLSGSNSSSTNGAQVHQYNFEPGSIVIDAQSVKDFNDVVAIINGVAVESRKGSGTGMN